MLRLEGLPRSPGWGCQPGLAPLCSGGSPRLIGAWSGAGRTRCRVRFRSPTPTSSLTHVVDGGSLLVNGSSMAIRPREHGLAYVAAKVGVHAAARSLALELLPTRIRVNVLASGLTDAPMVRRVPGHIESGLQGSATAPIGSRTGSAPDNETIATDRRRSGIWRGRRGRPDAGGTPASRQRPWKWRRAVAVMGSRN